jgi:DNA-binding transcriptional MerR regulator/methylmalonyl-CoA mutase cobalamin-binding subunit
MNDRLPPPMLTLSIAAVERDTGLTKDTLRVWERRYGFPRPTLDPVGERAYPIDQVARLRLIKRLLDAGHRPGRVVSLERAQLEQLGHTLPSATTPSAALDEAAVQACLQQLRGHDVEALRGRLQRELLGRGLSRFAQELLAPLGAAVGEAWLRGRLEVFEEHAFSEVAQGILHCAIAQLPAAHAGPRVLLATVPGEPHLLGLLMAQAMLGLHGARCVSLGAQTPVWDIVRAVSAFDADIVVLGFTGSASPQATVEALRELRAKLPPPTALWAGGAVPVLQRRRIDGVTPLRALEGLPAELEAWRARAAGAAHPPA